MNKIYALIFSLLAFSELATAQTFVQIGTGTDTSASAFSAFAPVYRASSNSGTRANRSNTLYVTSDLASLPPGATITALAWEKSNAGGTLPGNPLRLEIWMRNSNEQAPLSTSTLWSGIQSTHTLVYNNLNAVIPAVPGWVSFTLDQPFAYTGAGLEIATENQIGGSSPYATDKFNWLFTQGTGDFVIGVTGSTTFGGTLNNTTTSGAKNRSNIRIFYTPPPALDLQAQAVLSPAPPVAAGSTQQVQLQMANGGINTITSANIHYRLNGGSVVTESWTGSLPSTNQTTANFATPLLMPAAGIQNLEVWVSNVNGQGADGNPANDTAVANFCLALPTGAYSIGGVGADFASIHAAIQALNCGGIAGPVTFSIAPGNYSGFFELNDVAGAGQVNDITFTSATAQAGDVVIFNDSSASSPETFLLNGTKGVTFSFLKFVRNFLPTPATHVLHMRLGAQRIQVVNCEFVDGVGVITANNRAIGMFSVSEVSIIGNTFEGFGHAVFAVGENYDLNNTWVNNRFNNYLNDALFIQSQQGASIKGNIFQDFQGTGTTVAACSLRAQRNITVEENRVLGAIPRYAFNFFDFDNHPSGPNRIVNNEVVGFTSNTITSATAIRQCYVITGFQNANLSPANLKDQFDFLNNTAYLGVNSGSSNALQAILSISGGSDGLPSIDTINILNNNLVAYAAVPGGLPVQFRIMNFNVQAPVNTSWSNNNNFYFEEAANPILRVNSPAADYATLGAWTSMQAGRDSNSVSVNPLFLSRTLARPTSAAMDNRGTPLAGVLSDIEGAPRSITTPDIGAYEYDVPPVELALTNLLWPASACGISDTAQVRFQISNLGTDTLFAAELALFVNGQLRESKLFTDTVLAGGSRQLAFDSLIDFSTGGNYSIQIYPLLRVDANPANDTLQVVVVNQLVNAFPFVEDFSDYNNGIPAFTNGWSSSTASYRWFVNNGPTSTNATGPVVDATTGSANGRYLYVESSNGAFGAEATVTSACLDLSSLTQPMLEFWYHAHGVDCYQLITEQEIGGIWVAVDTLEGPFQQHSTATWLRNRVLLNSTATKVRFKAIRGVSFEGDWAIDDIRIAELPVNDARIAAMEIQTNRCDSSSTAAVVLTISNEGGNTLSSVPVELQLNGVSSTAMLSRSLLPGAIDTVQLQLSLLQTGNNALTAFTSLTSDTDFRLDTLRKTVFLSGTIRQFPYIDNFETATLWNAGGINSSWQRATPAATVLNSAFNGGNSWVTNATGLVNSEERSWLESPCFDFSQLAHPQLSFAIWYNTPATAGANLQYSTDGGDSWQVLGGVLSGSQWYTSDSVGVSAGQPVWSGVINPSGWRVAQRSLAFLAGQSSVKFRFQLLSPATNLLGEGIAIDSFRIADVPGSLPLALSFNPPAQCVPVAHTVAVADFTNVSSLQTAELRYSVNGGAEQTVPFTLTPGNLQAQIPAQAAGAEVRWYIRTTGTSGLYEGPASLYRDGFVQPQIANLSGPATTNLVVDALTAKDTVLAIGTVANQPAAGARMRLEALRHLEIAQMELGLSARTSLEVYYATALQPTTFDASKAVLVAHVLDARPDSSGKYLLQLQQKIQMQSGDIGFLYVKAFDSTRILVENMPLAPVVQDSNLVVSDALLVNTPFGAGSTPAQPAIRFFVNNPVDSIRWFNSLSGNIPIGTSRMLSVVVPTIPIDFYLEFETDGCVKRDTFRISPVDTRDVSVDTILAPSTWQALIGPVVTTVVLRNLDSNPTASLNLALFVNGTQLATGIATRSIPAGDTIHFSFPPATIPATAPGVNICVILAPDTDPSNDTACLFIADPTSVFEGQLQQIALYPNPAQTQTVLRWTSNSNKMVQLELRDALGRQLQKAVLHAQEQSWTVDVSALAAGVYYMSIQQEGQLITKKLLITR